MFMKYFEYIVWLVIFLSIIFMVYKVFVYIKKKHFQKIVKINVLRMQQKKGYITFYSSEILDKIVDLLFNKYEFLSFMSNESESKKILNPSSCTNISAKLLGFF